MKINTNIGALTAATNLTKTNDAVRSSAEKLSSGFRINKASDDAAGLGIANLFRSDIRALTQAQRNAEQATSVFSIAEGGASSVQKMLERMKELAAQAASDSVDSDGRKRIATEFTALQDEIDRVVATTEFQGSKLLDGQYGKTLTLGAGWNTTHAGSVTDFKSTNTNAVTVAAATDTLLVTASAGGISQVVTVTAGKSETVSFSALGVSFHKDTGATFDDYNSTIQAVTGSGNFLIGAARNDDAVLAHGYSSEAYNKLSITGSDLDLTTATLGVNGGLGNTEVDTLAHAQTALEDIDLALGKVNKALGVIGAGQNRVSNAIDNLKSTILNYQAAESAIRDLDMAAEMVSYSKNQILAQAGTAMLAQANQSGQGILKLLQ